MKKRLFSSILTVAAVLSLAVGAHAEDYAFSPPKATEYYQSTSYEDIYNARYNYGGRNAISYQLPELEYGCPSTTMTGVMERTLQNGLQTAAGGGYGIADSGPVTVLPEIPGGVSVTVPPQYVYQIPAYTSASGMERSDGSIGTVKIPSLGINMKVWEGETTASMSKGMAHYSSTSAWDGNVGVCGHNRGSKYAIGAIKDLEIGDTITYTTCYGTRTYRVTMVRTITNTDWSYLQATADNRLTLTTCVADHPEKRICVQAVEK